MEASDRISDDHQELWEKIEDVRVAMMTTLDTDGSLSSRPMWTQGDDFDGSLWFFISNQAPAAQALARDPRVGLSYAAPDKDLYLSVVGRGELVDDKVKARELWNTFAQAWFPAASTIRISGWCAWTSRRPSIGRTRSRKSSNSRRSFSGP
jgi:general stress protein 26